MGKKVLAVIFGGQSSEHEVSCVSVQTIINNVDSNKYEQVLIGITKDGKWLLVDSLEQVKDKSWYNNKTTAVISPDRSNGALILINGDKAVRKNIDVVFPVLHGLYGEDGTVQGLLELAKLPYVGCGVLSSAVSMDKLYTKKLVEELNIRQAGYLGFVRSDLNEMNRVIEAIENKFSYPVFVKPSNAGSSCGITKAHNRAELIEALKLAAVHDRKILVEETIIGREVECAVYGSTEPQASGVGEILAADEFYSYDAKYNNNDSKTVLSPELPKGVTERLREAATAVFKAVDGFGLARVDFFVEKGTNEVVFNEINTMPGFTAISMYPMLWEAQGVTKAKLVDDLINMSFTR